MEDEWKYTAEMHAKTMERVFESIHDIHLIVTRNEGRISEIKHGIDKVDKVIDGEGAEEGMKGILGTIKKQMESHWHLILGTYAFNVVTAGGLFMWILWWHK